MRSTSTPLAFMAVLAASTVLAAPAPAAIKARVAEQKVARRAANPNNHLTGRNISSALLQGKEFDEPTQTTYSSNWCGAVQVSPPAGTYTAIAGSWNLPAVSAPTTGNGEWYNSEWVGIDGDTCGSAILQAGTVSYVEVTAAGTSTGAYAWYEWYPQAEIEIPAFDVAEGDTVTVTITSTSDSTGEVVLENGSTSTTITVSAPDAAATLCGENAEWILEDFSSGGGEVEFADFAEVDFTGCTASTSSGDTSDISGATIMDIKQSGTVLASAVEVSSSELKITYGG